MFNVALSWHLKMAHPLSPLRIERALICWLSLSHKRVYILDLYIYMHDFTFFLFFLFLIFSYSCLLPGCSDWLLSCIFFLVFSPLFFSFYFSSSIVLMFFFFYNQWTLITCRLMADLSVEKLVRVTDHFLIIVLVACLSG